VCPCLQLTLGGCLLKPPPLGLAAQLQTSWLSEGLLVGSSSLWVDCCGVMFLLQGSETHQIPRQCLTRNHTGLPCSSACCGSGENSHNSDMVVSICTLTALLLGTLTSMCSYITGFRASEWNEVTFGAAAWRGSPMLNRLAVPVPVGIDGTRPYRYVP
jgi:hypothetical protein